MKITESDFADKIITFVQNRLGNIFFFNHIAVVELHEGIHFDINNAAMITDELISYFGNNKPFGIIANRVNPYSVNLLHTELFREKVKNMKAYGVVGHNLAAKMNAVMENDFCVSEKVDFETINEAITYVYSKVKNSKLFSLN